MAYITTEVEVYVDLNDVDNDEMVDHLEREGYFIIDEDEWYDKVQAAENIKSDLKELYKDYVQARDFIGYTDKFNKALERFFEENM